MDDFLSQPTVLKMSPKPIPAEQVLGALGVTVDVDKTAGNGSISSADPRQQCSNALSATIAAIDESNRAIVGGLAVPSGIARALPIASVTANGLFLDSNGKTFMPGKSWLYEGASHVVLVIATIGEKLERRVKEEFDSGNPLAGIVFDAMGTISLKNFTSHIRRVCAQRAAACGMETGPRIAPGCEAMPLEAQKTLFSLLDADAIGVTLSDSLLMTPLKSTSMVLPLGSNLPDRLAKFSMCDACPHRDRCMSIIL